MTSASPPSGRRDNGLPSAEWGALVDVDPRLSEALLDSLAAEGVPAYVEPAQDVDSYTRAAAVPNRPLDRLWVSPSRADLARGVVSSEVADLTALLAEAEPGATAHDLVRPVPRTAAVRVLQPPVLPGRPTLPSAASPDLPPRAGDATPSDDDLFQQIVAGFSLPVDDPVARWPVAEDLSDDRPLPRAEPQRRRSERTEANDALPSWIEPEALEDEGHFEPPPAPKVPRPRLRVTLAVLVMLFGLALTFAPFQIGFDDSPLWLLLGMLLTGGGGALLVASMRDARGDDGPDDGAVV